MTKAGPRTIHRDRVQRAVELHAAGLAVPAIADRIGVTVDRAAKLLTEGIRSLPGSDLDDIRAATEVRLDRLAAVYGSLLDDDDPRVRLQAANGLRQVEADRSRLLGTWLKPPKEGDY